ncbi:MAG: ParB/RepB/Spo0J family partition protein [Bacillota bacterium]|nr:ParB/RepB/Spo0J family partition protein [Bacillota bacterium]
MLHLKEVAQAELHQAKTLEFIPVERIHPNPHQPRKSIPEEGLDELAQSIRQYGLLQPIVVRVLGSGVYELIAGERRLLASRRAGLTHISAVVYPCFEKDSAMIALIENLQRENLHFFEEAEGYQNLLRGHGMTQEELAEKLGKNQSTIANKLRILRLSPRIKTMVLSARLTERHARALLRVRDENLQAKLIAQIVKSCLSVKESENLIDRTLEKQEQVRQAPRIIKMLRDHRIFVNTVKRAVEQLRECGIKAECSVIEREKEVLINVSIPKQHT